MLSAIGLLAVVGGTLAFKAHRASGIYFCSTTISPIKECVIIATSKNPTPALFRYCTSVPGATRCARYINVRLDA